MTPLRQAARKALHGTTPGTAARTTRAPAPLYGARALVWLVGVLAPRDRREEFLGDLIEEAETDRAPRLGRRRAALWLWWQVLASVPALVVLRVRRRAAPVAPLGPTPAVLSRFLAQGAGAPRRRRLPLVLSVALHAGLVWLGVVAAFWRVDELVPPAVAVTLDHRLVDRIPLTAPAARPEAPAPRSRPPKNMVKTASAVAPKDDPARQTPATTPDPARGPAVSQTGTLSLEAGPQADGGDDDDGDIGPGPAGHPPHAEPPPVPSLPPSVGAKRCLACPLPHLPVAYRRAGVRAQMLVKICADASGAVASTRVLRGIESAVDEDVARVLATWRYDPVRIDGRPVPFCTMTRFVFSAE